MLTDLKIRAEVPRDKAFKLGDADGLYLHVMPCGDRSWRYKYRFGGKEQRLAFGTYPDVPLKRTREMRDEARTALKAGKDPALAAQRAKLARQIGHDDTFERFAREMVRDAEVALEPGAR